MLTKAQKLQQSQELREVLSGSKTLFLLENTGLDVNETNELRSQIRKVESSYKVYRNTVVRMAVEGTVMEGLTPHLVGPKALAFTSGDGIALAKVLKEFTKEHPALTLEQAFLEGQILDPDAARKIADLPSREELVSKLLYLLQSPIRRLVVALNGPLQKLSSTLDQIAKKRESEGGSE